MKKIAFILKKHFLDLILVLIVFGVFFASNSPKESTPAEIATISPEPEQTNDKVEEIKENVPPSINIKEKSLYKEVVSKPIQNKPLIASPPTNENKNLSETFEQIKGGTVSTEAIIERNAYFKKLSEQLRDLQGDVNTESSPETDISKDLNNPDSLLYDDFDDQNVQSELSDEQIEEEIYQEIIEEMNY